MGLLEGRGAQVNVDDTLLLRTTSSRQLPLPSLAVKKREEDLRGIECGVTEINELLRQVSVMVSEQQTAIG